jgi:hypothetical protein
LKIPFNLLFTYGLALLQGIASMTSDVASGLQEAHLRNPEISGVIDHPSFQDLTASLTELNADNDQANTSMLSSPSIAFSTERKLKRLSSIVGFACVFSSR